eukprot:CAMPEP_0172305424 /NCGR_PEP_ID=MMETSP1058-20130122/6717_1 /TAXON_ID=83371 /ORGANISM="Detonula confervacea, Strain CCMP 353" /LENGTH=1376 /DNA_ID=CAMNT_0013017021 /DNA_START=256 /DNA_END=4386 /DNA_ORIENTATION=+
MALQARRFHGKPLLQPNYNFRDVPWCAKDLTGSTLSVVTERQHLVDSIAELTLVCSEATRRKKPDPASSSSANNAGAPSTKKTTKPLSIEYIFDRIDTDDPIWGLLVRTDTPMSFKGRASNLKSSPNWKRGMLQGFITMTTFTNWQSSFRFDSLHEMAFGQDDDELEEEMKNGLRKYDEDGSLAEELEAGVKGGNPHVEGIVYPRIAEVSLFGGLACGKQLLRLLIEHLECLKATARQNYDYIVLQATENSIPFYESMGFTRVGCVQGKAPSPDEYHTIPVNNYHTKKNGETPASIANDFGVDAWDIVFLNKTVYPELVQKSWLKMGTKIFIPKVQSASKEVNSNVATKSASVAPKWHTAQENETPRGIAKKFQVNLGKLLQANKKRYPDLVGHSRLLEGTLIQTNRFDIDEGDTIAYSHWTFPDADQEDNDLSYMMALKLNRKKGLEAKVKPVADSLAVLMQPFSPEACGVKDLLLQPKVPQAPAPLAPIFAKKPSLKEPKKPKRPMTSYAHFTADTRSSMAGELKGMSLGEVNKVVSEKWKAVSDEEKVVYQERFEESRAAYNQAMKTYEADMERFQRESPHDTTDLTKVDTSLLEKVVKLKSNDGISGASKFEYYYVLTFISDLQWVHLIPMRKAGVFGPENPDACGRPIWMIVGEGEGKEIDTTACVCQPVTALTVKNSADADDEQWNIYDNGEIPPAPRPLPIFAPKATNAPLRPKKPANSFALFCGDAKFVMKEQLENKLMAERTKIIAERWKVMTDEEKKKYKDQHAQAHEKYAKVLKQYKDDLAKFQRENPGIDTSSSSAISSKTPKSAKKIKPPAVSSPTNAENGESQKKKRGRPRKNPEAGMEETPTPKRKRGRPRKNPLPDDDSALNTSTVKAVVHAVKNNPIVLETLLGKLKGDNTERSESNDAPDKPGKNDVFLSLMDDFYKTIMWRHYNILGITRDKERENEVCDDVFKLLKQKMGNGGKFLKRSSEMDFEMDDVAAREKIIADIRRRVPSSKNWYSGEESQQSSEKILSPPVKSPPAPLPTKSLERGDNDVVLSLLNEKYKNIMWSHFKQLGRAQRGGTGEEETGKKIFRLLTKGLGKGGAFFKKSVRGDELFKVNDDVALQKITRDLKRRMDSSHKWLENDSDGISSLAVEEPLLTPTRKARREGLPQTSSALAESKPKLSPSRYPRRGSQPEIYPPKVVDEVQKTKQSSASPIKHQSGDEDAHIPSQPAEGLPEGWVTRRISRQNPHDSRVDTRWYSPELNLRFRSIHDAKLFSQRVEALGKGEAAAIQLMSPKDTVKPEKRPLAPIFLKDYGQKKKQAVSVKRPASNEEPKESTKASRYPGRKRKQVIDDSNFVSDDAVSDTSADMFEPRKKKAKTKC